MSLETIDLSRLALTADSRVLDVGCGEGRHTLSAWLGHQCRAVGIDISAGDLATAEGRRREFAEAPDAPARGSATFIRASAFALPFPDGAFDLVICSEVLEHIHDYQSVIRELERVLAPGGTLAVSVPRYLPERICWWLSDAYHEAEGGHIRIFRARELRRAVEQRGLHRFARHWAHALHVPYWWLRCLFWERADDHPLVQAWHRLLVWDLMQAPALTRTLERLLNPILGKSVVMYFAKESS